MLNKLFLFIDNSSDESFIHDNSDSSDDEKPWVKEVQKQYRLIRRSEREKEEESLDEDDNQTEKKQPQFYEIKDNVEFKGVKPVINKQVK